MRCSVRSRGAALLAAALLAVAVLAAPACSDDGDGGPAASTTSVPPEDSTTTTEADLTGDVPPKDATALLALYEEPLEELGLRLTPRGGLIDRSGGGYVQSDAGQHLALYVEPIDTYTPAQYVDGILDVTRVFAPDVFERWPGLESFDVCQEPIAAFDDRDEPLPITQIELSREQSDAIDWDSVTVADLVNASRATPPALRLSMSSVVSGSTELAEALAEG